MHHKKIILLALLILVAAAIACGSNSGTNVVSTGNGDECPLCPMHDHEYYIRTTDREYTLTDVAWCNLKERWVTGQPSTYYAECLFEGGGEQTYLNVVEFTQLK